MFFIMLLLPLVTSRHVFVSSPFDNFRLECPKRAAAVDLSIRMVESVGAKRQDIVFDMTCEGIDELFPWVNIPVGISEMEREDCYYSPMFDPILDETSEFSCKHREYLAGITRLTDTRIQLMCCRLRSRDEFNCQETIFNKPVGLTKSTIIENENRLINAIRLEESAYIVRFCDLAPRNIADIYDDVKTTTSSHHHSTSTKPYSKLTKTSAAPSTSTALPTIFSTKHRSSKTAKTPKPIHERSIKPLGETSTAPLNQLRQLKEDSNHGNSILEPEEFIDTLEVETTKNFHSTSYWTPSSKTKSYIMTTSTANTAVAVTQSTEQALNSGVETGTAERKDFQEPIVGHLKNDSFSNVENIIREIQQSSSEQAEKLFSNAVANLLNEKKSVDPVSSVVIQSDAKAFTQPSATPLPTTVPYIPSLATFMRKTAEKVENKAENLVNEREAQEDSVNDITVSDLSLITFHDEEFPKAGEKKFAVPTSFKVSKTDLPLKNGLSLDNFVFLGSINSDVHRRAPLRTHRPHVDIWSSEEDEMNGHSSAWEHTAVKTARPRKIVKLRKNVTRAHRLPTTNKPNEWSAHYKSPSSKQKSSTAGSVLVTRDALHVKLTTTASTRRDLPSLRKVLDSMTYKVDNAHSVDEETIASPFENEEQVLSEPHRNSANHANIFMRGDEDIEEVIMKLSATAPNIRRAPVRNSNPKEQKSDKNVGESDKAGEVMKENETAKVKNGNKTYISKGFPPVQMPEMAIFENQHKADVIVEDITKVGNSRDIETQIITEKGVSAEDELADVTRTLLLVNSKSFIGGDVSVPTERLSTFASIEEAMTTSTRLPSSTEYNTATFYHTPVAKPPKKEKLLTFCTKDVALRDNRNMVVACGGEHDIWLPSRCPQGADCFIAQDSTYRLCCPVSSG